jgi:hypothetical protein
VLVREEVLNENSCRSHVVDFSLVYIVKFIAIENEILANYFGHDRLEYLIASVILEG